MDSGGIASNGGFTNGGYSNPIDATPQSPTTPGFDLTYNNSAGGNAMVNLANPPTSPEWASLQHVQQHSAMTPHHSNEQNMTVDEPKHLHEQPPPYNPNGAPAAPPPTYYPSPMYMQPQQYPGQQQYSQQYPQQYQQQQVTVVGMPQNTPVYVVQQTPNQSYGGHIALACVTFWCCGVLFGLIAFILAVVADSTKRTDSASARQYGRASIGVSIAGIVIGVVLYIAIGVAVGVTSSSRCYGSTSYYYGYTYRTCY